MLKQKKNVLKYFRDLNEMNFTRALKHFKGYEKKYIEKRRLIKRK